MSEDFLQQDVRYVKGVGEKRADVWADAYGVRTVRDLLHFYPRRYLDRTTITPVRELQENPDPVTVVGTVQSVNIVPGNNQKRLEVVLQGEQGGRMKCTWFQGIWWVRKAFDEGDRLAVHGKVEKYGRWFSMTHPDFDHLNDDGAILDTGRIVPLYPGGEAMENVGLTSRSVRRILYNLFKEHGLKLEETLPDWIVDEHDLMEGRVALRAIHFRKARPSSRVPGGASSLRNCFSFNSCSPRCGRSGKRWPARRSTTPATTPRNLSARCSRSS
jgi:RecG-like helicase